MLGSFDRKMSLQGSGKERQGVKLSIGGAPILRRRASDGNRQMLGRAAVFNNDAEKQVSESEGREARYR